MAEKKRGTVRAVLAVNLNSKDSMMCGCVIMVTKPWGKSHKRHAVQHVKSVQT
jgi:hypothetical protein